MAVRREDPLLNLNTDVQEILEPGQSQLYAGARARLQQIYENATAEFRSVYQQQIANTAQAAVATAVNSSSVSDLTQVILRFQFTKAGQQALKNLIRLRLSRGELLQGALQFGRLFETAGRLFREQPHAVGCVVVACRIAGRSGRLFEPCR